MKTFLFTVDNLSTPDQYTAQTVCKRVSIEEQDKTVATQARFNVYVPDATGAAIKKLGGEKHTQQKEIVGQPNQFIPGEKIFAVETVNVASTVMVVTEE